MNVCLITHGYPRFPSDTTAPFIESIAETLQKHGMRVTVLTPDTPKFTRTKVDHNVNLKTYRYFFPRQLQRLGYANTLVNDCELKKIRLSARTLYVPIRHFPSAPFKPQAPL